MERNTHARTDSTLDINDWLDSYADDVPRWKGRRLAISMSHDENISTKILLE
jgi:hypothetical protein